MKYRKDRRTYKAIVWESCKKCELKELFQCSFFTECGLNTYYTIMWRETIPSKIRNWLRGKK